MPVGGLIHLNGIICKELTNGNKVMIAMDSKSFRKELDPQYKGNRVPQYQVKAQLHFAEKHWASIGVPVVKRDGYEADDIIYSACHCSELYDLFDSVKVFSADKDLGCNVSERCVLEPTVSTSAYINMITYFRAFSRKENIEWNTILIYKLVHGDVSDNVPALKHPDITYKALAREWMDVFEGDSGNIAKYSSRLDIFTEFIKRHDWSDDLKEKVIAQANLIFPKYCDMLIENIGLPCAHISEIDMKKLQTYLTITHSYGSLSMCKLERNAAPTDYSELKELGDSVCKGVFAADSSLPLQPIRGVSAETKFLGDF